MTYSILNTIGNTPLVEIKRLNPYPDVRILAKLEYVNPGGSIKDRPALFMIEAGEKSGELRSGKTVIEATSGNTGIGLALICSVKGYPLLLAMSESASEERMKILEARGAEILLTPGHLGTDGAIEEVYRLVREYPDLYYMTDQYNNEANWKAHYYGTAPEIWEQSKGELDAVVCTLGTSGTAMGIARRLKEYNSNIQIIGVEPYLGHKIQGLKNMKESYVPEIFNKKLLDKKPNIDDEEAFEMTRQLAKKEGLFVGMSSGAAMAAALKEAALLSKGTIVAIFPDSGERYLSTPLFAAREKNDLHFYNTMTRKKERFEPLVPGKVSMYSCGPTAHARMSLGKCRRFIFCDLLSRYFEYRGYKVTHIMNITDLDDKTIQGSEKAGMELSNFTQENIRLFREDINILGIKPASKYPRVSKHVGDMVELSRKLLQKGFAYEKLRSLYFDISKSKTYGNLSGIDLNKIRTGATVDLDSYEKDNPRDFTLLKRCTLSELRRGIYVKTDWGNVRPGWHIECAAIAMKFLGECFDIHTSSRELTFPHHENMIAIAAALTGKHLAKYWMDCDRVLVDGKKIEEKNSLTLQNLLDQGYTGREIRYWLLCTHYRKPVVYSDGLRLDHACHALKRLDNCIQSLMNMDSGEKYQDSDQLLYDIKHGFIRFMDDDLKISGAMSSIFSGIKKINLLISENKIDKEDAHKILSALKKIDSVLNIFNFPDEDEIDIEIEALIKKRNQARQQRNWELSDKIREELASRGVVVKDERLRS
ncbi:cysteinyl-tRNA synthetase [Candidatus Magnetomoraceae bacterium gMMP-15]